MKTASKTASKTQAGEVQVIGGVSLTCLGTDRSGVTSWITGGEGLAAKPLNIDWSKIGSSSPRLTSTERLVKAATAVKEAKAVVETAKASLNPLEAELNRFSNWQPDQPNLMLIRVARLRGLVLESSEQGYRLVKN